MDIFVSHVRRKQLPTFVFPDGYKRSRLLRHVSQQPEKTGDDDVGCWSGSAERRLKRKNDPEMVDVKPDKPAKRVSISPQLLESVSPEKVVEVGLVELLKLERLTTGDIHSNSEVRSAGEHLGGEEGIIGNHVQMGGTVVHDSVNLTEKTFVCKSNFPEVKSEVMLEKPSHRKELLTSCEVPNSLTGETCQIGLNGDKGAVDAAQELVKPFNQTMSKENAESVFEPSCNTQNLSCEGDVCAADLDSPLESGCFNESGVFQNSLSEDLEVVNFNS
ncbi:nuclear poly(A) polymerase 4 isoform X4 [Fagus crenata]